MPEPLWLFVQAKLPLLLIDLPVIVCIYSTQSRHYVPFSVLSSYTWFFFFCLRIILTLQIQSYYTRNAKCPYVLRLDWNGTIRCKKKIYMINTSTTFTNFRNAMIHSLRLEVILKPIMTSDAVWKIHCTLYTGMSFVSFSDINGK